jgi:hypothetical protein
MYEITVVIAVILLLASAIHYAKLAWQKPENPVLGTWILIAVMISLSFWMYWVSPKKKLDGKYWGDWWVLKHLDYSIRNNICQDAKRHFANCF